MRPLASTPLLDAPAIERFMDRRERNNGLTFASLLSVVAHVALVSALRFQDTAADPASSPEQSALIAVALVASQTIPTAEQGSTEEGSVEPARTARPRQKSSATEAGPAIEAGPTKSSEPESEPEGDPALGGDRAPEPEPTPSSEAPAAPAAGSTPAGVGSETLGPSGPGGGRGRTRGARSGRAARHGRTGPRLTASSNLGRGTQPQSDMQELLARHYPIESRRQGRSGSAQVAAIVLPSGRVGSVRVIRETQGGAFGAACRNALLRSHWRPPLDKQRRPTATRIRYNCRFVVND